MNKPVRTADMSGKAYAKAVDLFIAAEVAEGRAYADIGKELGVTRQRIYQRLRRMGKAARVSYSPKVNKNGVPLLWIKRVSLGLTQRELATIAGIFASYISRIERNKWSVSRTLAEKVAGALGVNVTTIFIASENVLAR